MVGVLILTHGGLAQALLDSARVISGHMEEGFDALPLPWDIGLEAAREEIAAAVESLEKGSGVLILTDIYGGTPSNVAMSFQETGRVEVVSGVNLPMVVRLGCLRNHNMPIVEMVTWIQNKGRKSICSSNELPRIQDRKDTPAECESCG